MDLLTYFVILLLPIGSSSIISQNELAFWTLLKEYHEMDLPAHDLSQSNDNMDAAAAASPMSVSVVAADAETYASPPGDVTLRLLVDMKSEPVQLRVSCAHGCRHLRRPCDLFVVTGYPLRMICYAMMPECMHYGHTTINCAVYSVKRWPEVVQAQCTLDYHTSESICASFEGAGRTAEAEKPFRLMLESLGVRLRPANWTQPLARADDDEQVSWQLAAAGLFAVLFGAFIVFRFNLAYWTPCSWSWFEQFEQHREVNNSQERCYGTIENALHFYINDAGRNVEIRTRDFLITGGPQDSKNFYKMVVVVINPEGLSSHELKFLLPIPASYSCGDGGDSRFIESGDNKCALSYTYLNSVVFPTGVTESADQLHGSQAIPLGYTAHSSTAENNLLPNCEMESSHLEDCLFTGDSALHKTETSEISLLNPNIKNEIQNELTTLKTPTENAKELDCSPNSTTHITEETHIALGQNIATKKLREEVSSCYTSFSKPKGMLRKEITSSLLIQQDGYPETPYQCFTSYQATSPTLSHQVSHATVPRYSLSLVYPATWVYPVILPQSIPFPFAGTPINPTVPQDLPRTSEEINTGFSRHSTSVAYPVAPEYRASSSYPNTHALPETYSCPETVVYSAEPTYTITPTYPMAYSDISPATYQGEALINPISPRYSQSTVNSGTPNVSFDTNYGYPGEQSVSRNVHRSQQAYSENSTYRENSGCQMTHRRESTYPSEFNPEYNPNLSNHREQNIYLTNEYSTISHNPATDINSGQNILGPQTTPSNQGNMYRSHYRPPPRRKHTSSINQLVNNQSSMVNPQTRVGSQTPFNHRAFSNQMHSSSHRHSNDRVYNVNHGNMGYPQNFNQRYLDQNRNQSYSRPLAIPRQNHPRSQDHQRETAYRPINVRPFPPSFRPRAIYQPEISHRPYAGYQPSYSQPSVNNQYPPNYQRVEYNQPVEAYRSAPVYQQSNFYEVEQPERIIQASCVNDSASLNQPSYNTPAHNNVNLVNETTAIQTSSNHLTASFHPTYTHDERSVPLVPPTLRETPGYQQVPVYHSASSHELIPPSQPSMYQIPLGYQESNRQFFPTYHSNPYESSVPTLPDDSQLANQTNRIPNATTFRTMPSEAMPNVTDHAISGYCANSPCEQDYPHFDSSLDTQTNHAEEPCEKNMCSSESTSGCSTSISHQDDNLISNRHKLRSDCPEFFPRLAPVNVESQVINTSLTNPPVSFFPPEWKSNCINQAAGFTSSQISSSDSVIDVHPRNLQISENREENVAPSYPPYPHTSNDSEFKDSQITVYNPMRCFYCDCNPGVPMFTTIPPNQTFSSQGPGQITGGGDAEVVTVPNHNLISEGRRMDQASNIVPNISQQGYGTRVELGSGDSHLIQRCEQRDFPQQGGQYYCATGEGPPGNICQGSETVANCYGENEAITTQYCYECSRLGYYNNCRDNCNYISGYTNPIVDGQNNMTREIPNDISENLSHLTLHNSDYSVGYNTG